MDKKKKEMLEKMLKGEASVKEAQEYLDMMEEEDIEDYLSEHDRSTLFETYRQQASCKQKPFIQASEKEIKDIWKQVVSGEQQTSFLHNMVAGARARIRAIPSFINKMFMSRYAMALAASLVMLVISPYIYDILDQNGDRFQEKGKMEYNPATLEFAIVTSKGTLVRADRPLMENDTIAFRVNVRSPGYCSIYVMHRNTVQKIVADRHLPVGVHDLDMGYSFSGNQGKNRLIMLFADLPLEIPEIEKQTFIQELTKNNVSSITIRSNNISITYRDIMIK